jgi:hypothetical protein
MEQIMEQMERLLAKIKAGHEERESPPSQAVTKQR